MAEVNEETYHGKGSGGVGCFVSDAVASWATVSRMRAQLLAVTHPLAGHSSPQSEDLFMLKATQLRFWIRRYDAEDMAGLDDSPGAVHARARARA